MSTSIALPGIHAGAKQAELAPRHLVDRVVQAGSQPISPASTAAFRIILGLLGVAAVIRFVANGWVSELYIDPIHHFTYYGFGWVQAWPGWGLYVHFALLGLASLCVALGYRYRLSIAAFFLLFTYVELIDKSTYLNHYYFVSLISFLMIFLPLNRKASFDSKRSSTSTGGSTIPCAVLWILRTQVAVVYVFAGIAKLNPDWLFHAEPLRIWLYNSTDTPLIGPFLREAWLPYAMGWGGALFDLTIVGWLLWRKTRPYAYAVLVIFHVTTGLLFPPIGMFPWIMTGAALLFFDPDWPTRLLQRLRGHGSESSTSPPISMASTNAQSLSWPVRLALLLAILFFAAQAMVPMRHLAYPGNVRWTEEGYRFSWRVLVTEKTGLVKFRVTSQSMETERLVHPKDFLTPTQVERFSYQPDMILAAAHMIRDDFIARGHEEVEVRVDAYVTFNGRPAARLIDPEVDLAKENPGFGPKNWILNAPSQS